MSDVRKLTSGGENAEGYFSYDERRFVYQRRNPEEGVDCDQIYTYDLRTGAQRLVSSGTGRTTCSYYLPGDSLGIPDELVDDLLRRNRTNVDLGLNAGAGLEFKIGPARLFTEFRYFLADPGNGAGYSGMLPITGGIRF